MRILVASDFYHPFIGGAELQVKLLAAALADRGHHVGIATVWHDGLSEHERDGTVDVVRLRSRLLAQSAFSSDQRRRFHPPFPDPWITRGLRTRIDEDDYDLVHANGWIAYSAAAAAVRRTAPVVLSVRDYGYSCAVRNLMHRQREVCSGPALAKCLRCAAGHYGFAKGTAAVGGVFLDRGVLARKVRAIHCVSHFVESIVNRDLVDRTSSWQPHVRRIPDIAPPEVASTDDVDPAMLAMLPDRPFILFVGQLQRQKGIHVLLAAYSRLIDPPPLVLIGTLWPDTPHQFPEGVTVIREAPHAMVLAAWERALFGVAPSVWPDPLPGVVREAMSRGRPVVGSAIGGIVDMIEHGVTGLTVPPGDPEALADAMARLLADHALRERLGSAARVAVQEFTPDAVAAAFEALYLAATNEGAHPS